MRVSVPSRGKKSNNSKCSMKSHNGWIGFPSPLGAKSPTIREIEHAEIVTNESLFPSPLGAKSPTIRRMLYSRRMGLDERVSVPSRGKKSNN